MENSTELELTGVQSSPLNGDRARVTLATSGGEIEGVFHPTKGGSGIVWVCGARGGLDGPSFGIFTTLSQTLQNDGISSLQLDYRFPGDFDQCVLDVLMGVHFLRQKGTDSIALVGHSFGGAVVIMAGTTSPQVKTVIGLSSQNFGTHRVEELSPRPLLLIHGERDRNLPVHCSRDIYDRAKEPKELVIYKGNGHFLRECHQELNDLLKGWLIDKLGRAGE